MYYFSGEEEKKEEEEVINWIPIGWRLVANQVITLVFVGGTGSLFRQRVRLLLHF